MPDSDPTDTLNPVPPAEPSNAKDAPASDPLNAAKQEAAAPNGLLEVVCARLRRKPPCDLRHRCKQRQRSPYLDGLVRDRCDP
jgi:hypothetical protein